MRISYEIRSPDLSSIYIGFDREYEARDYWDIHVSNLDANHVMCGAVVVRHEWESLAEGETARLDFLLAPGSTAKFSAECARRGYGTEIAEEWLQQGRVAIDALRSPPRSTATVIWPLPTSSTSST